MANKKRKKKSVRSGASGAAANTLKSKPLTPKPKLSHEQRLWLQGALQQAGHLMAQGQAGQASALYAKILSLDPTVVIALEQQGLLMYQSGQLAQAEHLLEEAVSREPKRVRSLYMLACVYSDLGRTHDAISCYERCIALQPDLVEAHNNLGVLYKNSEQFELAAKSFREVVKHQPNSAFALSNFGNVLKDAGYMKKALEMLEKAVKADRFLASAYSNLLITLNYLDDQPSEEVAAKHKEWGEHVPQSIRPERFDFSSRTAEAASNQDRKLRIGLVSPDLHQHSVAYFISPVFEQLDRQRFELFVYYNNNRQDSIQKHFESLADKWIQVEGLNEDQLANQVYQDRVDILIDLAGHTANNRLALFYQKPAPVQMSWIGYPNTTGLPQMDYRIVDSVSDPLGEGEGKADALASEKLLRMEHSFLCYDPGPGKGTGEGPAVAPPPSLNKGYVTFGSFNNLLKLTGAVIEVWSDILLKVSDARLLIKSRQLGNKMTRERVLKRFAERGITEERLILHEMVPDHHAHLALYNEVDIALDTFPYNGTTTTCEALWMGVPTLTLCGEVHASRVGASLLTCIGMSDFIANSKSDYIEKAVSIAQAPEALVETRSKLRQKLLSSPLCDQKSFVAGFESLVKKAWCDYLSE